MKLNFEYKEVPYEGRKVQVPKSPYSYLTLPEGGRQLRLLEVLPSSDLDDSILCRLAHYSMDELPPYTALSYQWGDPTQWKVIDVDGAQFPAGVNLETALRQLRTQRCPLLWIDAICINQSDVSEKTEQVKKMKDIYANATNTVVWLGPEWSNSDGTIAEINRVGQHIISQGIQALMTELDTLPSENSERYQVLNAKINEALASFFEEALDTPSHTLSFLTSLQNLFSREYWKRVWIIQELVVSTNIIIQCGNATIPFPQLYGGGLSYPPRMRSFVRGILYQRIMDEFARHKSQKAIDPVLLKHFNALTNIAMTSFPTAIFGMREQYQKYLQKRSENSLTLFEIFAKCYITGAIKPSSQASYENDRIFALLGMLSEREKLGIDVDYNKKWTLIYINTAHALIESGQVDLLSLSQPQRKEKDLPSWVPDWRAEWILRPCGQLPWDTTFAASGDSAFRRASDAEDKYWEKLNLSGFKVDVIEAVRTAWQPDLLKGCNGISEIETYLHDTAELCDMSNTIYSKSSVQIYANPAARDNAHIRIPVADQEDSGMGRIRRATEYCHQGYTATQEEIKQNKAKQPIKPFTPAQISYNTMMGWQRDRRPFCSVKGYVGLAPSDTLEGDVVVIFLGAKFPYVLRRNDDGTYSFIGESYVHGIMYGELMNSDLNFEDFTLR